MDANEITWQDFARDLHAAGRSERTLTAYRQGFDSLAGHAPGRDLLALTKADLVGWLGALRARGLKQASVSCYYRAVKRFYGWADSEELLPGPNPIAKIEPPQVDVQPVEIPAVEVLIKLIGHCESDRTPRGRRDEAMLRLLFEPGAPRASELANLTLGDIDMTTDLVTIHGKGGKTRTFPMSARTARAMSRWLRVRARDRRAAEHEQVFLGTKGRITRSGVFQIVEGRCLAAGVPPINPHKGRNYAAAAYLAAGGRASDLMLLMGWNSEAMVRRYTAAAAQQLAHQAARSLAVGNAL